MLRDLINLFKTLVFAILLILIIVVASLLFGPPSRADGIQLDQVYLNYKSFMPGSTNYLITNNGLPDRSMDKEVSVHLDTTLLSYAYWNNIIHTGTDASPTEAGQFRTVGWQFDLGLRVADWLDVQYEHHSQHILDWQGPMHFPVEDSIGVNIYLYRPKNHQQTLF